jgi:hypothetical protein
MIDRLVCADGGNPDPSSTHGKVAKEAKALELKGWPYPRHLAGRLFGVAVHGDSIGAESLRRALTDWLTDMALISAGGLAETDGYIGYMAAYATSHAALDEDTAFQEQVRNVARALGRAVILARRGHFDPPEKDCATPDQSEGAPPEQTVAPAASFSSQQSLQLQRIGRSSALLIVVKIDIDIVLLSPGSNTTRPLFKGGRGVAASITATGTVTTDIDEVGRLLPRCWCIVMVGQT